MARLPVGGWRRTWQVPVVVAVLLAAACGADELDAPIATEPATTLAADAAAGADDAVDGTGATEPPPAVPTTMTSTPAPGEASTSTTTEASNGDVAPGDTADHEPAGAAGSVDDDPDGGAVATATSRVPRSERRPAHCSRLEPRTSGSIADVTHDDVDAVITAFVYDRLGGADASRCLTTAAAADYVEAERAGLTCLVRCDALDVVSARFVEIAAASALVELTYAAADGSRIVTVEDIGVVVGLDGDDVLPLIGGVTVVG